VTVRIIVDGVGSFGLGANALRPLIEAGGSVGIFNPVRLLHGWSRLMRRNHRKMAVFDGVTAYIGGFGYGNDWADVPPAGWWDLGARITGPAAAQFRRVFARDWARCRQPRLPELADLRLPRAGRERLRLLPSVFGRHDLFRRLRQAARPARERVYVCTTYFIPNPWIRWALRRAARRGVDVRILLPGPHQANWPLLLAGRRHYGALLAAGVRIYEYQTSFLHAKYALVDRTMGLIGSSNLDSWSGRFNLEADLEVLSPGAIRILARRFLRDLGSAREITRSRWSRRPAWIRLIERFFGGFDPWL